MKLICWTQKGVDSTTHTIQLSAKDSSRQSLLQIDETGNTVLVNFDNLKLGCYSNTQPKALSTWKIPPKTTYLQTFKSSECPLTQKLNGLVLLVVSTKAHFHPTSSSGEVSESVLSVILPEVRAIISKLTLVAQINVYCI